MTLAFYRGPGDLVTHLIRWITRSRYSHVTLILDNNLSLHASGRNPDGVFLEYKKYRYKDWDFVYIGRQTDRVLWAAQKYAGRRFDWVGVWRFVFPFLPQSGEGEWYCSSLIVRVLQEAGGWFEGLDCDISPIQLYKEVTK